MLSGYSSRQATTTSTQAPPPDIDRESDPESDALECSSFWLISPTSQKSLLHASLRQKFKIQTSKTRHQAPSILRKVSVKRPSCAASPLTPKTPTTPNT